jgi:hypothetical protein
MSLSRLPPHPCTDCWRTTLRSMSKPSHGVSSTASGRALLMAERASDIRASRNPPAPFSLTSAVTAANNSSSANKRAGAALRRRSRFALSRHSASHLASLALFRSSIRMGSWIAQNHFPSRSTFGGFAHGALRNRPVCHTRAQHSRAEDIEETPCIVLLMVINVVLQPLSRLPRAAANEPLNTNRVIRWRCRCKLLARALDSVRGSVGAVMAPRLGHDAANSLASGYRSGRSLWRGMPVTSSTRRT